LATRSAQEWIDRLTQVGVPCAAIQSIDEMVAMPQVIARGMIVPVDDPALGTTHVPGNPIKMSSVTPRTSRSRAPDLDQNRLGILGELANRKTKVKG